MEARGPQAQKGAAGALSTDEANGDSKVSFPGRMSSHTEETGPAQELADAVALESARRGQDVGACGFTPGRSRRIRTLNGTLNGTLPERGPRWSCADWAVPGSGQSAQRAQH